MAILSEQQIYCRYSENKAPRLAGGQVYIRLIVSNKSKVMTSLSCKETALPVAPRCKPTSHKGLECLSILSQLAPSDISLETVKCFIQIR
jgi:hypothetical protein